MSEERGNDPWVAALDQAAEEERARIRTLNDALCFDDPRVQEQDLKNGRLRSEQVE